MQALQARTVPVDSVPSGNRASRLRFRPSWMPAAPSPCCTARSAMCWRSAKSSPSLGLVIPNSRGGVLHYGNFQRDVFKRAVTTTSLTGVTSHDLRHTYASWVGARGAVEASGGCLCANHRAVSPPCRRPVGRRPRCLRRAAERPANLLRAGRRRRVCRERCNPFAPPKTTLRREPRSSISSPAAGQRVDRCGAA